MDRRVPVPYFSKTSSRRFFAVVGIAFAGLIPSNGTTAQAATPTISQFAVGVNVDQAPAGTANSTIPTAVATHGCAVRSDGRVLCWGSNGSGELGNNSTTNSSTAVAVSGITTAKQVAVGGAHSCALLTDGTVKCWGSNSRFQTGDGLNTTTNRLAPVTVSGITTATSISAGNQHTCAALGDGTVRCWGANNYGQIGDATTTDRSTPVTASGVTGATQVSAGVRHTCAVLSDGTAKCWGNGGSGRLGRGNTTSSSSPVVVVNGTGTTMTGIVKVSAGGSSTCALMDDQRVRCWGNNAWGQIGNGGTTSHSNSTANVGYVLNVSGATGVSVGVIHACATLSDGTERCWGDNTYSQLGDGGTTFLSTPIDPAAFTSTAVIAAGSFSTCTLTTNDTIQCLGLNDAGQLGDGTTTNRTTGVTVQGVIPPPPVVTGLPAIASTSSSFSATFSGPAGSTFSCSLDGAPASPCTSPYTGSGLAEGQHTLSVTLTDTNGDTSEPTTRTWSVDTIAPAAPLLSGISLINNLTTVSLSISGEVGATFTCSLDGATAKSCTSPASLTGLADGQHTVRVRQTDAAGNAGPEATLTWTTDTIPPAAPQISGAPTGTTSVAAPSLTFTNAETVTYVCSVDGATFSACSTPFTLPSLNDGPHTFAVKAVDQAGNTGAERTATWTLDATAPPAPWAQVATSIATGANHSCSVLSDAQLACWGGNDRGQLGTGNMTGRTSPNVIAGLTNVSKVAAGGRFTCAVLTDQTARCWGANTNGQLGNGGSSDSLVPATVTGLTGVSQIALGTSHACAIVSDGAVRCWGANANGQLGNGDGTLSDSSTPVSVAGITGATALQAGIDSTCALLSGGTVKCWGNGSNGRLGNGLTDRSTTPVDVTGLTGVTSLGGGAAHVCAVTAATLKCWGLNISGQLGDGTTTERLTPTATTGLSGVRVVSGGLSTGSTCVTLTNGTVQCWGINTSGQLGDGTFNQHTSPAAVEGVSGVHQISSGSNFVCTLAGNATLRCWGNNSVSQLGDRTAMTTPTPVETAMPKELTGVPKLPSRVRTATITFSSSVASSFKCSLDSAAFSTCTSPLNLTNLTDGNHTIAIKAIDAAGNESDPASGTWSVDNTPPLAPTITSPPDPATRLKATSIGFTGENDAAFTCSWDGDAFAPCTTPATKTFADDGTHSFSVRQTDIAGNTSPSATVIWKIDTVAPAAPTIDTSLSGTPADGSRVRSASATIRFLGETGATFSCALDSSTYTECSNPLVATNLAEGEHRLFVRQTDPAGNRSSTPTKAQLTWTVDTTAPAAPTLFPTVPALPTKSRTASIGILNVEALATLKCKLDSVVLSSCPAALTLNNLTDGSHTIEVSAIDVAGNESAPATGTWTVDNTAPAPPGVTGAPTGTVNKSDATISFTGESRAVFKCSLDGETFATCTSPRALTGLTNKLHTFAVKQLDEAGNLSDATTVSWTVNRIAPPAPTLDYGPDPLTKSKVAAIAFKTSLTDVTFRCTLDDVDVPSSDGCNFGSKRINFKNVADGLHTFKVTQTNSIGNESDPLVFTWTVDTTGPLPPVMSGIPVEFSRLRDATISWTGEEGATFECSYDGGGFAACTSPKALSTMTDGLHTFSVRATDGLANVGSPATASWTIDVTPPGSPTVTKRPAAAVTTRSATFEFTPSSDEPGLTFLCGVDVSDPKDACTSPYSVNDLADGQHRILIKTVDRAGNKSGSRTESWTIDATAPGAPTLTSAPSGVLADNDVTVTVRGEIGSTYSCLLDGIPLATCNPPISLVDLRPGVHRFEIWQTDTLGNVGARATAGWTIDPTWPQSQAQAETGSDHTCAFGGSGGKVTCWGLAAGDRTATPTGRFARLSTGWTHSCAISREGAVSCWGANSFGQINAPTSTNFIDVTAGGEHSCSLAGDGSVTCWGRDTSGQSQVPSGTFTSISAGFSHTCGVLIDSSIKCWGSNADGRSEVPVGQFTHVSAGFDSTCAIRVSGLLKCWGAAASGITSPPTTVMFKTVSVGNAHACGTTMDDTLRCWGSNTSGQTTIPTDTGTWAQVSAGVNHTCATGTDETVRCWGDGTYEKTTVPDISQPGEPTITGTPTNPTGDDYATFSFSQSLGNTLECSLDGSAWTSCTSPKTYTGLSDGAHRFEVRQVNQKSIAGDAAVFNWTVDLSVPSAPVITVPTAVPTKSVTITVTAEEGAKLECKVDSATEWSPCASPLELNDLSEATHTIEVRQRDAAGNYSQSRTAQWAVDMKAPAAPSVKGQPAAFTKVNSAKITLTGEKGLAGGFECALDTAEWTPCTSPVSYSRLSAKAHAFSVRQRDLAGNVSPVKRVTWTIDTVAPALTGKVTAKKAGRNMTVSSAFDRRKGAPTLLEFNNGKKAPGPKVPNNRRMTLKYAPKLTVPKQSAVVWVRVGDAAGNWSPWIKTR